MSIPLKLRFGFLGLFVGVVGFGEPVVPDGNGRLRLEISLIDPDVVENEPVVLEVKVRNVSGGKQVIDLRLEPDWGCLAYEIIGPDGNPHRWRPLGHGDGAAGTRELAPGESVLRHQVLLYSPEWGVHFVTAGEYRIQALFRRPVPKPPPELLRSNTVTLRVRRATGADADALEYFRGNPQAKFLLGATSAWAIGDEFETILRRYPDSAYVPWCHYCLGRAWQIRREVRDEMKADKAMGHFEALLKKHPQFPLAVEVRYEIAKELFRLGRKEEALDRMERLFEAYPDWRLFQRANYQIETYRTRGLELPVQALP